VRASSRSVFAFARLICGSLRVLAINTVATCGWTISAISPAPLVASPRGLAVAADGTVYAVDATPQRVVHLTSTGRRLGFVGPVFGDAHDLAIGGRGRLYVVDTAVVGTVKRVDPDGRATTLSH